MDEKQKELAIYRYHIAIETWDTANGLFQHGRFRDAINRSYYASFYGVRSLYALLGRDFRKHKTLLGNFNKEFVATGIFPRNFGKSLSALAYVREQNDYDDFFLADRDTCEKQLQFARELLEAIKKYIQEKYDILL